MEARMLCLVAIILSTSTAITADEMPADDTPDAFEILLGITDTVVVSDVDKDGTFECAKAKLIDSSDSPKEATYVVTFRGTPDAGTNDVTFHMTPGETPDRTRFYAGDDADQVTEAQFLYTNHKSCSILQGVYDGDRCLLFVDKDLKDNVPDECLQKFGELCGLDVSTSDGDVC